jgi:hypothetical protein
MRRRQFIAVFCLASDTNWVMRPETSPGERPGRGWRGRSWAYFGLSFPAAVAPMIAMTVPTFSAVTSRKFGGSTSGWRGRLPLERAKRTKAACRGTLFQIGPHHVD